MAANVLAGISILLALFVLGSACYLRSRSDLRHTIDRVSFRLMLWSMIGEILFAVNYLSQIAMVRPRRDITDSSHTPTRDGDV